MRSSRILLTVAGVLIVAGALLVTTSKSGDSVGWFAYAPESDAIASSSFYLLTTGQVVGWVAVWMASLIVTGVVVRHVAIQGRKGNDDLPE